MLPFAYIARLTEWGLVQWYALCMVMGLVGFVFITCAGEGSQLFTSLWRKSYSS
jgi:hypothetical protein